MKVTYLITRNIKFLKYSGSKVERNFTKPALEFNNQHNKYVYEENFPWVCK